MSDEERAFSDEEDLFGSESEGRGSDDERALDVPSLSMDSLYVRSPLPTQDHEDEEAPFDRSVCETDQSGAGGFNSGGATSPAPDLALKEDELDPLEDHQEDSQASPCRRSGDDVAVGREELDTTELSSDGIRHCASPRMRDSDDQHELDAPSSDEKPVELEMQDNDRACGMKEAREDAETRSILHDVQVGKSRWAADERDEVCDPSLLTAAAREDESPALAEVDTLVAVSTTSEAFTTDPSPEASQVINMGEESTVGKPEQTTDGTMPSVSDPIERVAEVPVYTVESLFPVVYEKSLSSLVLQSQGTTAPVSISSTETQRPNRERRGQPSGSNPARSLASRLAALQSRLDAAHNELASVTRSHKLKLSMVETENKKLTQRNARLKTQLSVATADLQRSNAEMAKLTTENELYAAKLPQLQAELLEETSQVDETQAQSAQTQLALTQLKVRSHVLQTRALSLETQNTNLTQQLRECRQQLKRRTAALVQQTEKANKAEADMNELRTTHGQEKLAWKHRLATALQRFEHDKAKLEAQASSKERKELREAKDRAEKAATKRRAAEAATAKMEQQLKQRKRELAAASDTIHRQVTEVRTLEALLRKAHRTEATLRNDLAAGKTKLRSLHDEKKRQMARSAPTQVRRRQLKQQIPIALLLPLTDSSDDEESNQEDQACSHCLGSSKAEVEPQSPVVCTACPRLQDQVRQLQQDLRRVRSLHSAELHAQASVLDALLQQQLAVS
jgi:hypothetical protein